MEFNLRAQSGDFLNPVYDFPGDEEIPLKVYRACTQGSYTSTVATVAGAAEGCGLDLDSETLERWKRVLSAMDYLDDLLDESPDRHAAHVIYDQWIDFLDKKPDVPVTPVWVDTLLEPGVHLLRNSTDALPSYRKESLVKAARRIGQLAQEKAACTDLNEYTELLTEEGYCTAVLLSETVSSYVRNQQGFATFDNWAKCTTTWANIIFSSRDLKKDATKGTTSVEYSLSNRAKIARSAGRLAVSLTGEKPDRRATLGSIKTRLKYGVRRKVKD